MSQAVRPWFCHLQFVFLGANEVSSRYKQYSAPNLRRIDANSQIAMMLFTPASQTLLR